MGSRRLGALASSQSEHVRQLWRRSASGPVATATSLPDDGLTLQDFISQARGGAEQLSGALPSTSAPGAHAGRRVFIETYGCQMNVNDSEVVHSVLAQAGYTPTHDTTTADVILLNTCAIRDHAESKIWQRLGFFKNMKAQRKTDAKKAAMRQDASISQGGASPAAGPVVGVLGCMAERLKHKLLESDKMVDLVAGPDAYRDLPRLIDIVSSGSTGGSASTTSGRFPDLHGMSEAPPTGSGRRHAINVQLSLDETYADVVPVRPAGTRSAFLSIMRGCNNMCAFCVVPFTRGRERSRPALSIIEEVRPCCVPFVCFSTLFVRHIMVSLVHRRVP